MISILAALAILVGIVVASYLVEELRSSPVAPWHASWDPAAQGHSGRRGSW